MNGVELLLLLNHYCYQCLYTYLLKHTIKSSTYYVSIVQNGINIISIIPSPDNAVAANTTDAPHVDDPPDRTASRGGLGHRTISNRGAHGGTTSRGGCTISTRGARGRTTSRGGGGGGSASPTIRRTRNNAVETFLGQQAATQRPNHQARLRPDDAQMNQNDASVPEVHNTIAHPTSGHPPAANAAMPAAPPNPHHRQVQMGHHPAPSVPPSNTNAALHHGDDGTTEGSSLFFENFFFESLDAFLDAWEAAKASGNWRRVDTPSETRYAAAIYERITRMQRIVHQPTMPMMADQRGADTNINFTGRAHLAVNNQQIPPEQRGTRRARPDDDDNANQQRYRRQRP